VWLSRIHTEDRVSGSPGSQQDRKKGGDPMTKAQMMTEVREWLAVPIRTVELYKRGEPTFEVDANSHQDLRRFESVLSEIPDDELLALVKLEGHNPPDCVLINDTEESRREFDSLRERLIERELRNKIKFTP
jgi:hypothetical protein